MVSRRKEVECFKCGRPQMRLTNLEFGKYTNMSEKERQDYADAWLYIHRKKENNMAKKRRRKREEVDVRRLYSLYLKSCCC